MTFQSSRKFTRSPAPYCLKNDVSVWVAPSFIKSNGISIMLSSAQETTNMHTLDCIARSSKQTILMSNTFRSSDKRNVFDIYFVCSGKPLTGHLNFDHISGNASLACLAKECRDKVGDLRGEGREFQTSRSWRSCEMTKQPSTYFIKKPSRYCYVENHVPCQRVRQCVHHRAAKRQGYDRTGKPEGKACISRKRSLQQFGAKSAHLDISLYIFGATMLWSEKPQENSQPSRRLWSDRKKIHNLRALRLARAGVDGVLATFQVCQ